MPIPETLIIEVRIPLPENIFERARLLTDAEGIVRLLTDSSKTKFKPEEYTITSRINRHYGGRKKKSAPNQDAPQMSGPVWVGPLPLPSRDDDAA